MTPATVPQPMSTRPSSEELATRGWRMVTITNADGTIEQVQVPLTSEEFLHPAEGYHLPNSTFHDDAAGDAKDMLASRYAHDPNADAFKDLLIKWDLPDLKDHCPDTFVAFGLNNKGQNRETFVVAQEGTRPALIIEVVSPRYRKEDREIKVQHYAYAGVQEYVIIDRRTQRKQVIEEVLGYRLVDRQYIPISPDDEGRILCETVGVWISLQNGRVVMEDAQTGERLLNHFELLQRAEQERQRAEQAEQQLEQERQRAEKLATYLKNQGIDPDQLA